VDTRFGGNILKMFLLVVGSLALAVSARSQQGELSGFVRDATGASVPRAEVKLTNIATSTERETRTNDSGIYILSAVLPGRYELTVEASGFQKKTISGIVVDVAAKLTVNVDLAVGTTSESVTVSSGSPAINTTDASVSAVINRKFVENIPLNGRSFQSLLTIVPGVSVVPSQGPSIGGEVSVNGQRTEANYFTVDGVSANTGASAVSGTTGFGGGFNGSTPAETVLGTTQSLISVDALEEFRATTSTYSAEYGRSPGGQFQFNSRAGTDDWHGSAFDYVRNGALDANNWFNNATNTAKPAESQNDFGATFGGPVVLPGYDGKDKTFFFASYEGLRLELPEAAILTGVPSISLRAAAPASLQPILNAYPIPNGPDQGDGIAYFTAGYSSPANIDSGGIRVDHSFGDRFKIFGRFGYTSSQTVGRDPAELSTVVSSSADSKVFTLGATNILSPRLTNDFRFNITRSSADSAFSLDNFGGATPFTPSDIPGLGSSSDWFIFNLFYDIHARLGLEPQTTQQQQLNFTDLVSWSVGRHTLKFGGDYRRLGNTASLPPIYEFGYVGDANEILANEMEGAILKKATYSMQPVYTNFSAFIADEWKVTPRLTLALGLRWELNPPPGDAGGHLPFTVTNTDVATTQVAPAGTSLWHTTYKNFAPRVGFAYQLRTAPGQETVLRSGFGIYYDLGTANASEGYGGIGVSASADYSGVNFPFTQEQINSLPPASVTTPYDSPVIAFDPNLKLPYSMHWNLAVEQALGSSQTLTVNYVGSVGRRQYIERLYYPWAIGNPNFDTNSSLYLTQNAASSSYNALQVSYQRRLAQGLQAFASYTYSHAIDDVSSNFYVFEDLRASSDFDIRHNFQAALVYDIPGGYENRFLSTALKHWSVDARVTARSALPVDVESEEFYDPQTGADVVFHPNRVPGQPLYVSTPAAPGGRVINFAAFSPATDEFGDPIEGNSGRNSARGFGAVQMDFGVHRDFPIKERLALEFRAEFFNVFNNANFGAIYNQLTVGPTLFGQAYSTLNGTLGGLNSLYQTGGPRSIQFALRLHF
jgi:Carboxypeptidase regulatory-like domain/TonB-dependent Receptor Plug Domain